MLSYHLSSEIKETSRQRDEISINNEAEVSEFFTLRNEHDRLRLVRYELVDLQQIYTVYYVTRHNLWEGFSVTYRSALHTLSSLENPQVTRCQFQVANSD